MLTLKSLWEWSVLIRPEICIFPPTFWVPVYSEVSIWNCAKIKAVYRRAQGEHRLEIAQTIGLNCSMTHSPGKIEYNCRYFIMSFRKQIDKYKFGKNSFHTIQSTMSHRPLTNASSLKITAAYPTASRFPSKCIISWCSASPVLLEKHILWKMKLQALCPLKFISKKYKRTKRFLLFELLKADSHYPKVIRT